MRLNLFLFLLVYFYFLPEIKAQYITVDDTFSTQHLVEKVLVNSSCAQVSNFISSGDTFTAGRKSLGFFDGSTTSFPFKQGIFLSTGSSNNTPGPFVNNQNSDGSSNWKGDADLDAILGISSINASVIGFDFVPLTDFISFNYLFASNEYQSYFPCQFSDGFAFLIKEKGSTAPYQNLAVLPETTTPVASTSVHPFINPVTSNNSSNPGCPAQNEVYFGGYNSFTSPINYAGQTKVLTASSKVTAGKTYEIKLVIADDRLVDFNSAVFIEAGSFTSKIDLGPDRILVTNTPVCYGEQVILNTNLPATNSFEWFRDGQKIAGNQPSYTVTTPGTYKVAVAFSPTCVIAEEIKIEFAPDLVLNNSVALQCDIDTDGLTTYDLETFDTTLKNNDTKIAKTNWYLNLIDAQNNSNAMTGLAAFNNTSVDQVLYVKATSVYGCTKIATVTLSTATTAVPSPSPIEICDQDSKQDGLSQFDLAIQVTPLVLSGLPNGLIVDYYLSIENALVEKNKINLNFTNTQAFQQTIYARIKNGTDCYGITPITLVVNTFDPVDFDTTTTFICAGGTTTLSVSNDFTSYVWNTGVTTASIVVSQAGKYFVTVTNEDGCQKTKTFIVASSEKAVFLNAVVKDFAGNKNTITLSFSGTGNYEFSLDGIQYQDSPVFNNVAPGSYTARIRDKNGCGVTVSDMIYVLDYPRFFTPNGDGYNDTWKINNWEILPTSRIVIFDRFGKLIKELNSGGEGWNGTFTGTPMPSDDYWFQLILREGKIIKGHFSLKR